MGVRLDESISRVDGSFHVVFPRNVIISLVVRRCFLAPVLASRQLVGCRRLGQVSGSGGVLSWYKWSFSVIHVSCVRGGVFGFRAHI